MNDKISKIEISPNGLDNCILCGECTRNLDMIGKVFFIVILKDSERFVRITTKKDRFIFTVESNGSLTPKSIIETSFEVFYHIILGLKK